MLCSTHFYSLCRPVTSGHSISKLGPWMRRKIRHWLRPFHSETQKPRLLCFDIPQQCYFGIVTRQLCLWVMESAAAAMPPFNRLNTIDKHHHSFFFFFLQRPMSGVRSELRYVGWFYTCNWFSYISGVNITRAIKYTCLSKRVVAIRNERKRLHHKQVKQKIWKIYCVLRVNYWL